jgi:nitrate reductase assembly molybdenum cofactor insertion protein NarJ
VTALGKDVRDLAAAAAEWRLLSLLLSQPREGWHEEIAAVASEVSDAALRDGARAARGAGEGAYHALLGPGGPASAREAAHAGFGDLGRILADLEARYAAFGFAPADEPGDHLAVLCGFVSYLYLKEAFAGARGRADEALVSREERTRFLAEHVSVAGRGFAARLPDGAPEHLRAAAAALAARLPEAPSGPAPCLEDPLEGGCPAGGCASASDRLA